MPFKSKKQQRYAFATKQPWAEEFAQETKKIKRGKKKGFKALPEQVEKRLTPHQTAIKVAMKQARAGKMSVSDAQINADWAAKQAQRSSVRKNDESAFGVVHKATANEKRRATMRQRQKRMLNGFYIGAGAGAAGGLGLSALPLYAEAKDNMRWNHNYEEGIRDSRNKAKYYDDISDWYRNGQGRTERVWKPGTTGEKFESPKQAERVRRLRNLANHSSSHGTPEGKAAEAKLHSMGFPPQGPKESPGRWTTRTVEGRPKPEYTPYRRRPWTNPGFKRVAGHMVKSPGNKFLLGTGLLTGALAGGSIGAQAGLDYHKNKRRKRR